MNSTERNLIDLSAAALGTATDLDNYNVAEWDSLFEVAAKQGMLTILYMVIESLPEEKKPLLEVFALWQKVIQSLIYKRILYTQNIYGILENLKQASIPVIVLKGMAIARYYEKPEYRTMSDLDVFIENRNLTRAQEIIESMGYTCEDDEEDSLLHFAYHKKNSITIELHGTLVHSGFLGKRNLNDWINHIWAHSQIISSEGLTFNVMATEDEIINQIVHFGTHLVYRGTYLKHLFDMALIIKSCGADLEWGYIGKTLKTMGFYEFAQLIFAVCVSLFRIEVPAPYANVTFMKPDQFIDDFLNYYSVQKPDDDMKGWLTITCRFPSFYRQPLLLPLAWLVEYMSQFKVHGLKIPIVFINARRNIKISRKKVKVLKSFWGNLA